MRVITGTIRNAESSGGKARQDDAAVLEINGRLLIEVPIGFAALGEIVRHVFLVAVKAPRCKLTMPEVTRNISGNRRCGPRKQRCYDMRQSDFSHSHVPNWWLQRRL
jgi:hypothetical protein